MTPEEKIAAVQAKLDANHSRKRITHLKASAAPRHMRRHAMFRTVAFFGSAVLVGTLLGLAILAIMQQQGII